MARLALERLCQKRPELQVVQVCQSAEEALEILKTTAVDLLFLDVEMPGLSGLQLLNNLSYWPQVIMTTAKTEYAFDAFQYQVSDYLRKPISLPRFMQAVDKLLEKNRQITHTPAGANDIFVKTEGRYIRLSFDAILFIEHMGDHVQIKTTTGGHLVHTTMKSLNEKLPGQTFFRVHQSFIINLSKIVDIDDTNLVIAGKVIPISRAKKPDLMEKLNLL